MLMRVELISYTKDADAISASSALGCADPRPTYSILEDMNEGMAGAILDVVLPSGHHSVIEHSSYTFSVEGVSRSLTHQLVRHRVASFSQQSQRYIRFDTPDFIIPPKVERNPEARELFLKAMDRVWKEYNTLVAQGIPEEDARYVLPNAAANNITITMNARELLHFFKIRCCTRAQWEIRDLADRMLALVKPTAPRVFRDAGASCVALGYCPETECCGLAPRLDDIKQAYENQQKS
jgi:thymidylate synthase (FAD)